MGEICLEWQIECDEHDVPPVIYRKCDDILYLVPMGGVEPPTTGLWVLCSTAELHWHERNSRDFPKKATLYEIKRIIRGYW